VVAGRFGGLYPASRVRVFLIIFVVIAVAVIAKISGVAEADRTSWRGVASPVSAGPSAEAVPESSPLTADQRDRSGKVVKEP